MTFGNKIRCYRILRGMSQKELGLKCGFTPSTAGVRIFQYEKNMKIPRPKLLKTIADVLGVEEIDLVDDPS